MRVADRPLMFPKIHRVYMQEDAPPSTLRSRLLLVDGGVRGALRMCGLAAVDVVLSVGGDDAGDDQLCTSW